MNKLKLDDQFWNERWVNQDTSWDIGYPSPAIVAFADRISNKSALILIPGCGNAYEAEYLHQAGFTNVFVVDYAAEALRQFSQRVPTFPKDHLIQSDFFAIEIGPFDYIIEQTFFCAIDPELRQKYVSKMHSLLKENGILAGLLFNDPLNEDKPPFGGNETEYRTLFGPSFTLRKLEPCLNSIGPRAGRELWFEFQKP